MACWSLGAVEFGSALQPLIGERYNVPSTFLFNHPTMGKVADFVEQSILGTDDTVSSMVPRPLVNGLVGELPACDRRPELTDREDQGDQLAAGPKQLLHLGGPSGSRVRVDRAEELRAKPDQAYTYAHTQTHAKMSAKPPRPQPDERCAG